jgi:hypothetical protein
VGVDLAAEELRSATTITLITPVGSSMRAMRQVDHVHLHGYVKQVKLALKPECSLQVERADYGYLLVARGRNLQDGTQYSVSLSNQLHQNRDNEAWSMKMARNLLTWLRMHDLAEPQEVVGAFEWE